MGKCRLTEALLIVTYILSIVFIVLWAFEPNGHLFCEYPV